jgi:branched-chain amino acid transport system permease protein
MITTIGLAMFLENFALVVWSPNYWSATYFTGSINLLVTVVSIDRLFAFALTIVVTISLILFFRRTIMGKALRAVAQDVDAAAMMGIDSGKYYTFAHGLGSMLAGLAGSLLLPVYMAYPYVGTTYIMASFSIVILGGLGSIEGSLLAGVLLGITESLITAYLPVIYVDFFRFSVIAIVLLIKPSGLFGRET